MYLNRIWIYIAFIVGLMLVMTGPLCFASGNVLPTDPMSGPIGEADASTSNPSTQQNDLLNLLLQGQEINASDSDPIKIMQETIDENRRYRTVTTATTLLASEDGPALWTIRSRITTDKTTGEKVRTRYNLELHGNYKGMLKFRTQNGRTFFQLRTPDIYISLNVVNQSMFGKIVESGTVHWCRGSGDQVFDESFALINQALKDLINQVNGMNPSSGNSNDASDAKSVIQDAVNHVWEDSIIDEPVIQAPVLKDMQDMIIGPREISRGQEILFLQGEDGSEVTARIKGEGIFQLLDDHAIRPDYKKLFYFNSAGQNEIWFRGTDGGSKAWIVVLPDGKAHVSNTGPRNIPASGLSLSRSLGIRVDYYSDIVRIINVPDADSPKVIARKLEQLFDRLKRPSVQAVVEKRDGKFYVSIIRKAPFSQVGWRGVKEQIIVAASNEKGTDETDFDVTVFPHLPSLLGSSEAGQNNNLLLNFLINRDQDCQDDISTSCENS